MGSNLTSLKQKQHLSAAGRAALVRPAKKRWAREWLRCQVTSRRQIQGSFKSGCQVSLPP